MKLHIAQSSDASDSVSNGDTRQHILKMAARRFRHYGYNKTTVHEIAEDCGMSSGNLYRYFASKLDIAVHMTRIAAERSIAELRPLLDCPRRSEEQRLVDCVFFVLRNTYSVLENTPHMVEMAHMVMSKNPQMAASLHEQECDIYEKILMWGRDRGEFKFAVPPAQMAKNLQIALWKFRFSQMASNDSLEELETQLAGVMQMVLDGLKSRQQTAIRPAALDMDNQEQPLRVGIGE